VSCLPREDPEFGGCVLIPTFAISFSILVIAVNFAQLPLENSKWMVVLNPTSARKFKMCGCHQPNFRSKIQNGWLSLIQLPLENSKWLLLIQLPLENSKRVVEINPTSDRKFKMGGCSKPNVRAEIRKRKSFGDFVLC
jgi:hypothetical protein